MSISEKEQQSKTRQVVQSTVKITLLALFIPLFFENILKNLMSTVNIYILSALSDQAVAAVGVSTQIFQMVLTIGNMCANGAVVVICQSLGARDSKRASEAASTALVLISSLIFIFSVLCYILAPSLVTLMNAEETLKPEAISYLRILALGGVFEGIITAISGTMRSYGKPRYALYATLFMNVLNAIGGYLVVFRPIELPLTGITGVAYMRVFSEFAAMLLMIIIFLKANLTGSIRDFLTPQFSMVKPILSIALPSGVETFSYSLSQTVTTAIVATLGSASISAKVYVQNIVFYVYLLGMSLGGATSIMIGHSVGSGDYEKAIEINKRNLRMTLLSNGLMSLLAMLLRYQLLGLFTQEPEIIKLAAPVMILDFFVELGRGTNHIEQNSLRAVSDVKIPMIISLCTSWGCSILFSYILGVKLGLGLPGCWIAYGMEEVTRCILLRHRWKQKKWIAYLNQKKASEAA